MGFMYNILTYLALVQATRVHATLPLSAIANNIGSYAALGDSYASGNGAGAVKWLPRLDPLCGRFADAYPVWIANASGLDIPAAGFRNAACGGATTASIIRAQLPLIGDSQVVTLTVGGNEVDFFSILNECVHQWRPVRTCDQELEVSRKAIQSSFFIENYDRMINYAVAALAPGSLLLVTGYARFFNADTEECNNSTFSVTRPDNRLSKELRGRFNELITMLNDVILAACQAHGAVYVDIDRIFDGHRFCENGVTEPADRPETWFFNLEYDEAHQHYDQLQRVVANRPINDFFQLTRVFHPTGHGHKAISMAIIQYL